MSLLEIEDLTLDIHGAPVLQDVSVSVGAGRITGLIGESGSGKSMTALAAMQLLPRGSRCTGQIRLDGHDMLELPERRLCDLRGRVAEEVSFGGITFRRYRGGLGFGVPTDKAYFYPEGVEGLFEIYYAPADTFETVNTVGLPLYARMIPDRDRDEWVRLEIESNPLPICTRPQVLRSARRT